MPSDCFQRPDRGYLRMMKVETARTERLIVASQESFARNEQIWLVQATVSHVMGIALSELCAPTRRRPQVAQARQIAMYLCHIVFEIGICDAARAFGRDPSTVTHALRRIEEMRDEPEFDTSLTMIETLLLNTWKAAA